VAKDWITGWWSTSTGTSVNQDVVLTLITSSELEDKGDSLRVERVIGQFCITNTNNETAPSAPLLVHCRLVTRPSEITNGPYLPDISLAENAEEFFMWHKVLMLPSYNVMGDIMPRNNMEPRMHPEWSHIDCKVKRALNNNEELLLTFQPVLDFFGASDTGSFSWAAWIRVLVSS